MLLNNDIFKLALKEIRRLEHVSGSTIVLAGFIGSRINGLGNNNSDYDIRAIALDSDFKKGDYFSVSHNYGNICFDTKIYWFNSIYNDSLEWIKLEKNYPTITSPIKHPLIHNDATRSIIRLAMMAPIYNNISFFSENREIINWALRVVDSLDYEYSRAYMNYQNALSNEYVNVRKYLYTLYEIFSIHWILKNNSFPKDFFSLLTVQNISKNIYDSIEMLLEINEKFTKENAFIKRNKILNDYIQNQLQELGKAINVFSENSADLLISFE